MKRLYYLIFLLILIGSSGTFGQKIVPSERPNPTQQKMVERGYGMFIHFGINTFGETEWSDGSIPVENTIRQNWTVTNGYGLLMTPDSVMYCSRLSIMKAFVFGTVNIRSMMSLLHL